MNIRPDLAVRELSEALAEEPENARAHAVLSMCLLDLKKSEEAFAEAREAIRLAPADGFSFYALARCHMNADQFIEAEVAIEEALEDDPFNCDYLWFLALVQVCTSDFEQARQTLDRSLEYDPEHASSHSLRAYVLNRLGKTVESDASNDAALALTPEDAWSHTFRGWALVERQKYKDALGHFREALRLDPTINWAREGLIRTAPSQHWAFRLHLRLKNKFGYMVLLLWFFCNVYLHVIYGQSPSLPLLLSIYLSWLSLALYLLLLFLPDSVVSGPVLKFLLQLEPDGRFILTNEERKHNLHLIFFLAATVVCTAVALINQLCWPLELTVLMFWLTRPFILPEYERGKKCYIGHGVGAAISVGIILLISVSPAVIGSMGVIARSVIALQFGKLLLGGSGLKLIAGGLGAGALAGAAKQKKKEEARKKMMKEFD